MARINIEDSLYKDNRFISLFMELNSVETAIGALIRVWSVAQEYYLKDDRKIPLEVWKKQGLNDAVLRCGLATEENGRISVSGADSQFKWLLQRVEAGKLGGRPKTRKVDSITDRLATDNRPVPPETGSNPLPLTLPLTLTQNVVTENIETKINENSLQKIDDRMAWLKNKPGELDKIRLLLDKNKLFGLKKYVQKICTHYGTADDFANFVDDSIKRNCKQFADGIESAEGKNFLTYIVKDDIGAITKKGIEK
jgi:hypothetical protein